MDVNLEELEFGFVQKNRSTSLERDKRVRPDDFYSMEEKGFFVS